MQYQYTIMALSPVFIGDGTVINKKEYLYNPKDNRVYIPSMRKMIAGLGKRKILQDFENYLMNEKMDLKGYFAKNRIPFKEYIKWMKYGIPLDGDLFLTKEIHACLKNSDFNPYIPGSSLKGTFRTMLENYYFLSHPETAKEIGEKIKKEYFKGKNTYFKRLDKHISVQTFHQELYKTQINDEINSIMSRLSVSDTIPLTKDDLCIVQHIEHTIDGENRPMPYLMEAIRPGTKMTFTVNLDKELFPVPLRTVMKKSYEDYQHKFINKFPYAPSNPKRDFLFYLGGGTGYGTKTITYSIFSEKDVAKETGIILENLTPYNHKHHDDYEKGVSPHILKCTEYHGKVMQTGLCTIKNIHKI